jgi:hypothetical protein
MATAILRHSLRLAGLSTLAGCAMHPASPERVAAPARTPAPASAAGSALAPSAAAPGTAPTSGPSALVARDVASPEVGARLAPRGAPQAPAWGTGDGVSYVVPAVEIVAFEFLLNQFDRHFAADDYYYETDWDTFRANLESGWVTDRDPFGVNQLGHPYSGAIYHNFARSTGHEYWVALAYTFVGSLLWETAGETTPPSLNDQITTGIGGTFLGEALFRSASRIHEDASRGTLDSLGATLLSPPLAFNRWAFDRFDGVYPSHGPAVLAHLGAGVRSNTFVADNETGETEEGEDAGAEYSIEYGLPGKRGYAYGRPFDYFQLEIAASSDPDNHFAHVRTRGLLVGDTYQGDDVNGVYGLYGIYDYLSPGIFRVASTALGFGTTAQLRLSQSVALQGTALLGAGFGAAGTVADDLEDRDYHYGGIPQGVLDWRLVLGDVAMVECAVRDYLVYGVGSDSEYGAENIVQGDLSVTLRVVGGHALRAEYVASARDTHFETATDANQSIGTLLFGYTFLGDSRWGVVQ